ncbi:MAG: hypothetical protein COB04_06700 [Gammaproteobacteria bacterium]|nr:MAG: hypothetical protein COB04_06700 [Gammaproteobacteria bacterium]
MTDKKTINEGGLPFDQEILKRHRGISPLWILPLLAMMLGGWFYFQNYTDDRIFITIEFDTGEGIVVEKTEIIYKGISVGKVVSMAPKQDLSGVIVTVGLPKETQNILNDQTEFWIVKPRFSMKGVSGVETLLSGNYINMRPSFTGVSKRKFIALMEPPPAPSNSPGLHLTLTSNELGSISEGNEVLFRKVPIGSVRSYRLNDAENGVEIDVHIEEQYQHLIKKDTRFWNASGVSVKGNLSGLKIKTESIASLITGGIAFTNPEDVHGERAETGDVYELYTDFDDAEVGIKGLIHFATGKGLTEEATKIIYQGVQVGLVRKITLADDLNGVDAEVIFNPKIEHMLNKGTRFWRVGAKFSMKGVSNLETMLFGEYITFKPGKGEPTTHFSAANDSPLMDNSTPGLHVTLRTPVLGSISVGSEIFYRKIPIGEVKNYEFSKESSEVLIHLFIKPEAAKFINSETKFYNSSGISVKASLAQGLKIQTESLSSLVSGGISIATELDKSLPSAKNSDQYKLYEDYDKAFEKGMMISLEFPSAEGLSEGSSLKYQGIPIGEVKTVKWFDNLKRVKVEVLLYPEGEAVAREGSLFWVAVLEMGVRMKNVDALFGAYIQVKPGNGAPKADFIGLDYMTSGSYANITSGVNVRLKALRAETIIRNDPVFYRELIVGKVTGFELSPDSQFVYILVNIREAYAPLIRENTVFWNVSGTRCGFQLSTKFFDCMVAPLETLLAGGLSFATPPVDDAGVVVDDGHIFDMHWDDNDEWYAWNPGITVNEGVSWKTAPPE